MNNPITFKRDDYCNNCNSNMSIELYNIYNKPVNYTLLLNDISKIDKILDKHELQYFKCKKCGKIYLIDWIQIDKIRIPIPLRDKLIMDKFENIYLKDGGK